VQVVAYQVLAYRGQLAGRSLCLALIGAYGLLVGALVNLRKLLEPKLVSERCLTVTCTHTSAPLPVVRYPHGMCVGRISQGGVCVCACVVGTR
jgi:hypothetical protein